MKTLLVLSIAIFSTVALFGQTDTVFTVRIGNFLEPQSADFEDLRPIGFLFADSIATDLYLISLGMYSTRGEAESIESAAKSKGYPDADVEPFIIKRGAERHVIQMATLNSKKTVRWKEIYAAYPNISVKLLDEQLIVFATGFKDLASANAALGGIRKAGFSGAFPKTYPMGGLIEVTEFETGGIKKPEQIAPPSEAESPVAKTVEAPPIAKVEIKPTVERKVEPTPTPKPPAPKPQIKTEISKPAPTRVLKTSYPKIDGKIKRNAAIELQRVLKSEKVYASSLDGFYGPGTTKGYENFKAKNRQWKKYVMLSDLWKTGAGHQQTSDLQQAIFDAYESPTRSTVVFENSKNPLAMAYMALIDFRANGASQSVNNKMNLAIKGAFPSKKLGNRKPFDYTATYAYQDYGQFLQHLKYMHMASEDNLAVPCWIFNAFPKESAEIFSKKIQNLKMQECTGVEGWEEIRVLQTLASDITPDADTRKMALASAQKSRLLLAPSDRSKSQQLNLLKWNDALMGNLAGWATRDPMHKELVTTFKVAYYQSQVRLESYFIENDIRPDQARFLALATLNALVGEQMSRFTE